MDSYPIRVRSVNVRGPFRDRLKTNSWRNRSTLNVVTIKRHAPTLIGFQECRRDNRRAYGKGLPRYADLLGPKYGNAVRPDSNALLFDPKGPELLDSGGLWPGETPEKYSSSWEAGVVRSANWALLRIVDTGLSLLHLITHFDHKSGLVRREGSRLIIDSGGAIRALRRRADYRGNREL